MPLTGLRDGVAQNTKKTPGHCQACPLVGTLTTFLGDIYDKEVVLPFENCWTKEVYADLMRKEAQMSRLIRACIVALLCA